MSKSGNTKKRSTPTGSIINNIQTLFVGLLRIWTIPIVLMLSLASGFTTYYGLSHFITPWIALVITVAIQSIIVICSLEIAGIHWKANRLRYFSVVISLFIALTASISFSYFKFYEVSQKDDIHINRLNQVREDIKTYLNNIISTKGNILTTQQSILKKASDEATQAYFGTHPLAAENYRNQVGDGPFFKHYNQIYLDKKQKQNDLDHKFSELDKKIEKIQGSLDELDVTTHQEESYSKVLADYRDVQLQVGKISSSMSTKFPDAPLLMTYQQFTQEMQPSVAMLSGFSVFAFICAAMVDFFTFLLSYRLEFTAPGPLTQEEEEMAFECLLQFTEFNINENDELQMVIEKTALEKAHGYSDWSRMFAVGLLLNRGFLRKIDDKTVEFSPNLYPLIAEKMGEKINQLKAEARLSKPIKNDE